MSRRASIDEFAQWLGAGLGGDATEAPAKALEENLFRDGEPAAPVPAPLDPDGLDEAWPFGDGDAEAPPAEAEGSEPDEAELEEITDRFVTEAGATKARAFEVPRLPRLPLRLSVRGRTTRVFSGVTRDVARSGLLLESTGPFTPGEGVRLSVALPDGRIASLQGHVVRVGRLEGRAAMLQVGLRLLECDDAWEDFIAAQLRARRDR